MQQNGKESRIQKNPEINLLYQFHAQKNLFNNNNFFRLKMTKNKHKSAMLSKSGESNEEKRLEGPEKTN